MRGLYTSFVLGELVSHVLVGRAWARGEGVWLSVRRWSLSVGSRRASTPSGEAMQAPESQNVQSRLYFRLCAWQIQRVYSYIPRVMEYHRNCALMPI
jgi:hypothetical protein